VSDRKLPLDPKPYYVIEAYENDEGPESGAGRYTRAAYVEDMNKGEYGGPMSNLARFLPREGYEQDEACYKVREERLPGKTLAESLGIEVDPKAPGGQKMGYSGRAGDQSNTRGRQIHNELNYEGFHDNDAYR
jgi:hypothetical protein